MEVARWWTRHLPTVTTESPLSVDDPSNHGQAHTARASIHAPVTMTASAQDANRDWKIVLETRDDYWTALDARADD